MRVYAFLDIHLLTPVLVTGPGGGDPNSEITLTYIPGSVVRGLFAGRYAGIVATGTKACRANVQGELIEKGEIDSLGHKLNAKLAREISDEVRRVAEVVQSLLDAGWRYPMVFFT